MLKADRVLITLLLLNMIWCSTGHSESPLIPLQKIFDNPKVDGCQISPDGNWMSCLKPYHGKLNVFVRDLHSREERPITAESERPVMNYFWSGDSKMILYLQDQLGDENYHLFAVPVEAKTPSKGKDLTPFKNVTVEVVSIPHESSEILITMNQRKPELMDAYWLDIQTGKLQLTAKNLGTFTGYLADLSKQVRVATGISPNGETEVFTRESEKEAWIEVKKYSG